MVVHLSLDRGHRSKERLKAEGLKQSLKVEGSKSLRVKNYHESTKLRKHEIV